MCDNINLQLDTQKIVGASKGGVNAERAVVSDVAVAAQALQ